MDKETLAALSKVATSVEAGTAPSSEAYNPDHKSVEDALKSVQAEQLKDPKTFAPALKNAPAEEPTELSQEKEDPTPETSKELNELLEESIKPAEVVICPRCGWDCAHTAIKPSEEDIKEFSRNIFGDKPFTKTYDLMGGNVHITFREIASSDKDKITEILKTVEPISNTRVALEVLTDIRRIQALYCLVSITAGDSVKQVNEIIADDATAQSALDVFNSTLGKQAAGVVDIILRTYSEFDRLLKVLTEAAFDENFWKGAGLD